MGDIFIQYLKQEMHLAYPYARRKIKQTAAFIDNNLKKLQTICIALYQKKSVQKLARLSIIFPMFLVLLSGFIEEKKTSFYGSLSFPKEQLHPLTQNFIPMISVPNSGMVPINNTINNFFTQYETSKILSTYENMPTSREQEDTPLHIVSVNDTTKNNTSHYVHLQDTQSITPSINPQLPMPSLDVNVAPNSYSKRKRSYTPYARSYARKYGLDPNMIIAIMYAESTFYPHLISNKNAHGLMQIVPATAGTEVNRFFKKKGEPSLTQLMNPEVNIRYGSAYLYLLKKYHLTGISDPKTKDLLIIASYNAGSGAVLRHFSKSRMKAISKINTMTFNEVLTTILTSYRSIETRRYVKKVLAYMGSI